MKMEDLFGLGKGSEKLIDVIANAVGAVYRPFGIRREADAEAYKLKVIEKARAEQKAEEIRMLASAKKDEVLILDSATSTLDERAAARKRFNELRQQNNLENVLKGAFGYIKDDVSEECVDPDWLQSLIKYAEEANSEQLQDLWSRVLAGETELPGSFSLRALETLKKMSKRDAQIFQDACYLASYFKDDGQRMVIYDFYCPTVTDIIKKTVTAENQTRKSIKVSDYNFGLHNRKTLDDLGLVYDEVITSSAFNAQGVEMIVAGIPIKLTPKSEKSQFHSYRFTQIGNELSRLIDVKPHSSEFSYYSDFLRFGEKAFIITQQDQD
jgi:uncharacterized repeat protein (TIGR03899 family)